MEDKILISLGWCRVRPHHKLIDQSDSISYDFDPFWPAETLFNAVSTTICSHLINWQQIQDAGKWDDISQRPTIDPESGGPAHTRTCLAQS